jgi:hypothetical protein
VTCSGAFTPGEHVPVTLNMTATVQGCGDVSGVCAGRHQLTSALGEQRVPAVAPNAAISNDGKPY